MTRVRSKANPELVGVIVADALDGDVYVEWDDAPNEPRMRIAREGLEEIPEPERTEPWDNKIPLSLLDALDRLRDSMNLALECIERDIRREMKKKESP